MQQQQSLLFRPSTSSPSALNIKKEIDSLDSQSLGTSSILQHQNLSPNFSTSGVTDVDAAALISSANSLQQFNQFLSVAASTPSLPGTRLTSSAAVLAPTSNFIPNANSGCSSAPPASVSVSTLTSSLILNNTLAKEMPTPPSSGGGAMRRRVNDRCLPNEIAKNREFYKLNDTRPPCTYAVSVFTK